MQTAPQPQQREILLAFPAGAASGVGLSSVLHGSVSSAKGTKVERQRPLSN